MEFSWKQDRESQAFLLDLETRIEIETIGHQCCVVRGHVGFAANNRRK